MCSERFYPPPPSLVSDQPYPFSDASSKGNDSGLSDKNGGQNWLIAVCHSNVGDTPTAKEGY